MQLHKIAITGSNGSVGQRTVVFFLNRGFQVLALDTTPIGEIETELEAYRQSGKLQFTQVDLRSYEDTLVALKECKAPRVDGLVHLAGIRNPSDYKVQTHNTNVVLSYNVLRACAELGINRVAQASSINVFPLVFSTDENMKPDYFLMDENCHTNVDEPYGLSKVICEIQAAALCRRYTSLRIASLRLHWSLPHVRAATTSGIESAERARRDLWGWIQEDEGARAFWLALTVDDPSSLSSASLGWKGHEAFIIAAPTTRLVDMGSKELRERFYPHVPVRQGFEIVGQSGFFDCSKAARMLGWVHREE